MPTIYKPWAYNDVYPCLEDTGGGEGKDMQVSETPEAEELGGYWEGDLGEQVEAARCSKQLVRLGRKIRVGSRAK